MIVKWLGVTLSETKRVSLLMFISSTFATRQLLDVRQSHQYNNPQSVGFVSCLASHLSHPVQSAVISGRYITRGKEPCELYDLPAGFTVHSSCFRLCTELALGFTPAKLLSRGVFKDAVCLRRVKK